VIARKSIDSRQAGIRAASSPDVLNYLHADMEEKERAIARVTPPGTAPGRYQPPDPLLAFLDSL